MYENRDTLDARIAARPGHKVTPEMIDAAIVGCVYFTAAQGARMAELDAIQETRSVPEDSGPVGVELRLLTICVLTLRNGFTVLGQSACADPVTFDPKIGRELAYKDAVSQVWRLEGYLLKQALHLGAEAQRPTPREEFAMPEPKPVAGFNTGADANEGDEPA